MRRILASLLLLASFQPAAFAKPLEDMEYNKFDSNGSVRVSVQAGSSNIGDVDVLSLPSLPAGSNAIGAVKDAGVSYAPIRKWANVGGAGNYVAWDPAPGKKAVITDAVISTNAANTVTLKLAGVEFIGPLYFAANGGLSSNLKTPIVGGADENVTFTTTAGSTTVTLTGYEE